VLTYAAATAGELHPLAQALKQTDQDADCRAPSQIERSGVVKIAKRPTSVLKKLLFADHRTTFMAIVNITRKLQCCQARLCSPARRSSTFCSLSVHGRQKYFADSLSGIKQARKADKPSASYQSVLKKNRKAYLDTQKSRLRKGDVYFLRIDGLPLNKICRSIIQHCVVNRLKTTPSWAKKRTKMPQLCGSTEAPA
jgi:hypothetical protein